DIVKRDMFKKFVPVSSPDVNNSFQLIETNRDKARASIMGWSTQEEEETNAELFNVVDDKF
ncbi:hypothetical protein BgiBS90_021489, partial [Biomphalaria glabrata]